VIRTRPPRDHKCTGLTLLATPELVADYLEAKAEKGSEPALLARHKADRQAPSASRSEGSDADRADQAAATYDRAREGDGTGPGAAAALQGARPRCGAGGAEGLNVRGLLEACGDNLPRRRDRALALFDVNLGSELVTPVAEF
jgi:hypothetical protein